MIQRQERAQGEEGREAGENGYSISSEEKRVRGEKTSCLEDHRRRERWRGGETVKVKDGAV